MLAPVREPTSLLGAVRVSQPPISLLGSVGRALRSHILLRQMHLPSPLPRLRRRHRHHRRGSRQIRGWVERWEFLARRSHQTLEKEDGGVGLGVAESPEDSHITPTGGGTRRPTNGGGTRQKIGASGKEQPPPTRTLGLGPLEEPRPDRDLVVCRSLRVRG